MRPRLLELRARNLLQFLAVCSASGLFGVLLGSQLTPVPGQLFTDVLEVPLVYLVPVLVAASLAQWTPVGAWWVEHESRNTLPRITMLAGTAVATVPEIVSTGGSSPSLIAMRNAAFLVGVALLVRSRAGTPASAASVLVPSMIVWTFGWDPEGRPQPWAILLAPAGSTIWLILTVVLLSAGLARTEAPDQ